MKPKSFAAVFLGVYVLVALPIVGMAAWLEPFEGDLTRVGGLSENFHGWNQPQKVFPENLTTYHVVAGEEFRGGEEIVVFGDSFSHIGAADHRTFGWQNYLSAATGLGIHTYNVGVTDFREWLLRQNPADLPDFVVYERVERNLSEEKSSGKDCQPPLAERGFDGLQWIVPSVAGGQVSRDRSRSLDLQAAAHWLKVTLRQKQETRVFKLTQAGLFSSVKDQKILLFEDDFLLDKSRQEDLDTAGIACFLAELRELAESNGRTRFIVAVVPDKSTAYRHMLEAGVPDKTTKDLFMRLEEDGIPVLRFDRLFQNQVAAGLQDLYLPNDTHWGSEGNRVFASAMAQVIGRVPKPHTGHYSSLLQSGTRSTH